MQKVIFGQNVTKKGSFSISRGGKIHVNYSEGVFRDLIDRTQVKVSFHRSGVTHIKTENRRRVEFAGENPNRIWISNTELEFIIPKPQSAKPILTESVRASTHKELAYI